MIACNKNDECFNETCPHFSPHGRLEECDDIACVEVDCHVKCIDVDELEDIRHPEIVDETDNSVIEKKTDKE